MSAAGSLVRRLGRVCRSGFFGTAKGSSRRPLLPRHDARNHRLRLEPLEDRRMLSVGIPGSGVDDGSGHAIEVFQMPDSPSEIESR